jgi:hypothetical protein
MRAVWSFWSKPYLARRHATWPSETHHLLSWVLAVESARRHFSETHLYTDDAGAQLLVGQLGLEFTRVSTELNALADADPAWWALGKLYTYHLQDAPFVHLDNDVFLWKRPPERVTGADVFAQNPEPFRPGFSYYQPERVEAAIRSAGGWLPAAWVWYRAARRQRGECCGIFGGRRVDFIRAFADQALRLVQHPANQRAWAGQPNKVGHKIVIEQYLLAAAVEHQRALARSPGQAVAIAYLFSSPARAFDPAEASRIGYTHLIADAKRNPLYMQRLEARVRRDLPGWYERCARCAELLG